MSFNHKYTLVDKNYLTSACCESMNSLMFLFSHSHSRRACFSRSREIHHRENPAQPLEHKTKRGTTTTTRAPVVGRPIPSSVRSSEERGESANHFFDSIRCTKSPSKSFVCTSSLQLDYTPLSLYDTKSQKLILSTQ